MNTLACTLHVKKDSFYTRFVDFRVISFVIFMSFRFQSIYASNKAHCCSSDSFVFVYLNERRRKGTPLLQSVEKESRGGSDSGIVQKVISFLNGSFHFTCVQESITVHMMKDVEMVEQIEGAA